MSAFTIYEVRQRSWDKLVDREVTYVVDKGMANNTIDRLYKEVWKTVMHPDWQPDGIWFPLEAYDVVKAGLDTFQANDLNGPVPLFYAIPHLVFNVVPTFGSVVNSFTISPVQTG